MMKNQIYFKISLVIRRLKRYFAWHKGVKSLKRFVFPLLNVVRLISDRLSGNLIKAVVVLLVRIDRLRSKNGLTYVSTYLKACHIYVMQYVSVLNKHSHIHSNTYGIHVSVTKSGLPRILPRYFREDLQRRNSITIKIVLTIFNLYRVLPYPGKVKLSTITDKFAGKVSPDLLAFIPRFWKLISPKPFTFIWNPYKISSSGSVTRDVKQNSTSGFLKALMELRRNPLLWGSIKWFFESAPQRRGWISRNKNSFTALQLLADKLASCSYKSIPLGKLAFKDEPGKVRVFAMVDCITQWVLRPLHDWIFSILRNIPTDATFDQEGGVEKIRQRISELQVDGFCPVFSLDLSAATDRLPIALQIPILEYIAPGLGRSWSDLLVKRTYFIDDLNANKYTIPFENCELQYGTGQPMGANSSWGMLAITHHFIVQYCSFKIYHTNSWFMDYMVLGDDIIILDPKVAKLYLRTMENLRVGVNISKSLISTIGCAEFAKKFITPVGRLEGLSLKEFSSLGNAFSNIVALGKKLNARRVNMLRLLGFGPMSSGRAILPFVRRSYKSFLDHLFISPLMRSDYSWKEWFVMISPEWRDELDEFTPYIMYLLWSFEVKKYQFVMKLGRRVHEAINSTMDDRIRGLLNFWLPSSFTTCHSLTAQPISVWVKDKTKILAKEDLEFLEIFENNIFKIFANSAFLSELTAGGSSDLVSRCISWELSFEEGGYSRFEEIDNDHIWSVIARDPKSWVNEKDVGIDVLDIDAVMAQVKGDDFHRPCTIKDISKALSIKEFLVSHLWRGKELFYHVPLVSYPKIWRTKKVDSSTLVKEHSVPTDKSIGLDSSHLEHNRVSCSAEALKQGLPALKILKYLNL